MIYGPSLAFGSFSNTCSTHTVAEISCSCLVDMAEDISTIRAALQTLREVPPQSFIPHVRELCQANAAVAEALVFISQSSSYHAIGVEAEAERNVVSENGGISDLRTDQEENAVQETHNMLQGNTSWRRRSEHAVVRLAQYWIQRKLAGSTGGLRTVGDADEHRLLVDLRKAVLSSTPVVLSILRGVKRKRSSDGS